MIDNSVSKFKKDAFPTINYLNINLTGDSIYIELSGWWTDSRPRKISIPTFSNKIYRIILKPTSPETKANNPSTKKPTTHKKALKKPSKKSKTSNLNSNPPKTTQKSNALRPNSTTSSKSCTTSLSSQLKISKKTNSSHKTNPTRHTGKIYWRQCTANASTSNSKLKLFSCTFTSSIRLWKHPKAVSSTCKAASTSATRAFSWHRSMKKSTLLPFTNGCLKTSISKCTSGKARLFLRSILNWFMKVCFTFFSTGLRSLRLAQLNARNVPRF